MPTMRIPKAMIQPARATPRNERRKKGLTIRRNSQARQMATPRTTDSTCDCGSVRNHPNLSANPKNKKLRTTKVSKKRNNLRQYLVESETCALMRHNGN